MSNARLYGTPVATDILARAVVRATKFEKQAGRKPCLATVLVGHSDSGDLCFFWALRELELPVVRGFPGARARGGSTDCSHLGRSRGHRRLCPLQRPAPGRPPSRVRYRDSRP